MRRNVIVILVVLSLVGIVLMSGCTGTPTTPQNTTKTTVSVTQTAVTTQAGNTTIKPTVTVTIPVTGVFVKISYLGSFNASYGMKDAIQKVTNSGDRVYEIVNATGTVSATAVKRDESTTHDITIGLYKNGALLTSAKNSSAFGNVSISFVV
jgi:uncharacterized protein YceK